MEKLEEEPWSNVEATLCNVVQRNPLFKEKRMMVKVKDICDDKESSEFEFKVFLSKSTVTKSKGDPKILKRGPKGDPILSKKGTKRGPKLRKRGPKVPFFRIVGKE